MGEKRRNSESGPAETKKTKSSDNGVVYTAQDAEKLIKYVEKLQKTLQKIVKVAPTVEVFQETIQSRKKMDLALLENPKSELGVEIKDIYDKGGSAILSRILGEETTVRQEVSSISSPNVKYTPSSILKPLITVEYKGKSWPPLIPEIKDGMLFKRVFTHRSMLLGDSGSSEIHKTATKAGYDQTGNFSYERLEFVGDSIVNNILTKIIYDVFPGDDQSHLSFLRGQVIANIVLCRWAAIYGFPSKLRVASSVLSPEQLHILTVSILSPRTLGADANMWLVKYTFPGGYASEYEKWYESLEVKPKIDEALCGRKIVADLFEAYVAGVYLSYGAEGEAVLTKWVYELAQPLLDAIRQEGGSIFNMAEQQHGMKKPVDGTAKNRLYILIGSASMAPVYNVVSEEKYPDGSVMHTVTCSMGTEILGTGKGKNLVEAGARAAMAALDNTPAMDKFAGLRTSQADKLRKRFK
ncbi:Ribonuclease 3 [Yarrowia sp. C11]|nr:Ribonuclease 3 [Yarrowia sp. E02]KAG5373125.1 Ribonuclease 3 [Yarrowia sp. C11]